MESREPTLPAWVLAAAKRPLAFAQVREDPLIDEQVVADCAREANGPIDVVQIASGGCTAALLAALPQVARLVLVDPNPAQLALTRLKLWLRRRPISERLALLRPAAADPEARAAALRAALAALELADGSFGPLDEIAVAGPDQAGRYELVFAELRRLLGPLRADLDGLLALRDPAEQSRRAAPGTALGDGLDHAFAEAMALPWLVHLFSAGATRNAVLPFARHFTERLRWVLAALPAADNPFLWQVLAGGDPPGRAADWLRRPVVEDLSPVAWQATTMDVALAGLAEPVHLVHLSNILDWLPPDEATRTLALAWAALRPGGRVVIRQLNSSLDIPALGSRFAWLPEAATLHRRDRSFFYRRLHIGRKP